MEDDTRYDWKMKMRRRWPWAGLLLFSIACTMLGTGAGQERVAVQQWLASRGPVVPHDSFPSDCMTCHEGGGWHRIRTDFQFDHEKETGTRLIGAHKHAECLRCHNDRGPVQKFANQGCTGCHEEWHKGQLGSNCSSCHDERTWQPKQIIAQHRLTRFPLVGSHAGVACWACHPGAQVGEFKRASTDCVTCHRNRLATATVPDHQGNGWTSDCQRCHSPIGWKGASFVHTIYPITGAHKSLACGACHKNGVYKGTPRDCVSCHQDVYNSTANPPHVAAAFSTNCQTCHSTSSWKGAIYTHKSYVPTGAHVGATCTACHKNNVYVGTSSSCVSCHQDKYNATTDPNHTAAGFNTSCETCHNTSAWRGANWTHSFPRTGPHNVSCATCHTVPGNFKVFDCLSCHKKAETDKDHKGENGYSYSSPACLSCHPKGKS